MAHSAKLTRTEYEAARRTADIENATQPRASKASVSTDGKTLTLVLAHGVTISMPLAGVPGLASIASRRNSHSPANVVIEGDGEILRWPDLDVDLSVPNLIADALRITTVSANARRAGSVTTAAKAAAVRENGKKGGRPRNGVKKPFA
jgi:Protein of unknown function (DUF2442)